MPNKRVQIKQHIWRCYANYPVAVHWPHPPPGWWKDVKRHLGRFIRDCASWRNQAWNHLKTEMWWSKRKWWNGEEHSLPVCPHTRIFWCKMAIARQKLDMKVKQSDSAALTCLCCLIYEFFWYVNRSILLKINRGWIWNPEIWNETNLKWLKKWKKSSANNATFFHSKCSKEPPKMCLLTSIAFFFFAGGGGCFFVQAFVHNVSYEPAVNVSEGAIESAE